MKLVSVQIKDYKCIYDSNEFDITDITCLVGKNEAGKTAILQALYKLNPVIEEDGTFDITDDYPRVNVEDYLYDIESGTKDHTTIIKAKFLLEDADIEDLKSRFGSNILNDFHLSLSKKYESSSQHISLDINEAVFTKTLLAETELSEEIKTSADDCCTLENLCESLQEFSEQTGVKAFLNEVQNIQDKTIGIYIYKQYLQNKVPKFLYYDEYYQLSGQVNINQLQARKNSGALTPSDRCMLSLVELARLDLDKLMAPKRTEWLNSKLEGASNHLTKQTLKYWSQNKFLEMRFDVRAANPHDPQGMTNGVNLWGRVYNTKRRVSTSLGVRSRGFVWFFSFLAWYNQQKRKQDSLILLLDEPALFLHGRAQEDLLNYIEEELKNNHQIIYTTHSPFMVNSKKFDRVRIVEDKSADSLDEFSEEEQGTKVLTDVLETSDDSLFPLQGALGYELYQTLFIGPNCLVVEGVSDFIFLSCISEYLEKLGRVSLDKNWTITPVGGAGRIPTFIAIIGSQSKMNLATLIDIEDRDKPKIENLYKKKLLKKSHIITYADFTDLNEADLEDMFEPSFYLKLVNKEYKNDLEQNIKMSDLPKNRFRILKKLNGYLKEKPFKNQITFSHYRPARYLSENTELMEKMSEKVIKRFENAFKAINKLLT